MGLEVLARGLGGSGKGHSCSGCRALAGRKDSGAGAVTGPRGLFQVLDTYMFHAFLKARLSRRMDAFAQMDLHTQSEEDRCAC